MILNIKQKIIILMIPKTGTTSIRVMFDSFHENGTVISEQYGHTRYDHIARIGNIKDLESYKIYGFYREPIARFVSTFKYLQKELKDTRYPARNKMILEAFPSDTIKVKDVLAAIIARKEAPILDIFDPQIDFLRDDVILLDFEKYEDNVRMLLDQFGLDSSIPIIKQNVTNSSEYIKDLSQEDLETIREYYKEDYAFFERHGIVFEGVH